MYDNNGTTNTILQNWYDNNGTTNTQWGNIYDNNGVTNTLLYQSAVSIWPGINGTARTYQSSYVTVGANTVNIRPGSYADRTNGILYWTIDTTGWATCRIVFTITSAPTYGSFQVGRGSFSSVALPLAQMTMATDSGFGNMNSGNTSNNQQRTANLNIASLSGNYQFGVFGMYSSSAGTQGTLRVDEITLLP